MSVTKLGDNELIILLKDGSHTAYAELYQRYYRLLFIHAYKRSKDQEQAKDIVQEFFVSLWDKRKSISLQSSLAGYFFTAINNRLVDHFLHQEVENKYIASFAGFLVIEQAKTDHLVREKQLMELIENEIGQLPPKMREVFELSRKENLSHKEIAEKLAISEKTVDRQISNALFRLKTRLGIFTFLLFLVNH
jgi:RNA polymerase sigma-70 factor (ECF subfamily)